MPQDNPFQLFGGQRMADGELAGLDSLAPELRASDLVDADFEARLPADYAELGEQLRDDAHRLSDRYPAGRLSPGATAVRSRRRWPKAIAAALLLAAGGGIGVLAERHRASDEGPPMAVDAAGPAALSLVQAAPEASGKATALDALAQDQQVRPRANPAGIQEVAVEAPRQPRPPIDEVEMLKRQLEAFEQVIRKLQTDLARKDALQTDRDQLIESLRQEIAELKERLPAGQARAPRPSRAASIPAADR